MSNAIARAAPVTALLFTACASLACTSSNAYAEWARRGDIKLQLQGFTDSSVHSATHSTNASVSGTGEFSRDIGENLTFTLSPFFRVDEHDSNRSHADLRELNLRYIGDNWELLAGLGKVFWGVAESRNPVDIINQRDAIEGNDAAHKFGQPMINLLLLRDWGDISLFVLPGFRERSFAGVDGRPRISLPVSDDASYESSAGQSHVDVAARVSGVVDEWDIGAHVFHGTARNPLLQPDFPGSEPVGQPSGLSPFYYQVTQAGIDAQATLESWLLKGEVVYRSGKAIEDHVELVSGFEYSFYGVAGTDIDVGLVVEWLYDERAEEATQPFQNDLVSGVRIAANDAQSSEALVLLISDLDGGGQVVSFEASRRLGDAFRVSALANLWQNTSGDAFLQPFSQEDFIELELAYFF